MKSLFPQRFRALIIQWGRWWRYWYLKILRQEGTPEAIARGWSCGVFAGSFPLFGLQTVIGLCLATIFRGNKLTAAAGTWVSNPLTYVPIYYFNLRVGEFLLRQPVTLQEEQLVSWSELSIAGINLISTLFIGCAVVGSILATSSYFLALGLTYRWRSLREKTQQRHQPGSSKKLHFF